MFDLDSLTHSTEARELIARGAIFYVSHSAGKDSQAMFAYLREIVPADQLVVVHADLGEVEHSGVQDHIRNTIGDARLEVVRANKTFLEMVENRYAKRPEVPCWPSSATRQCTSDLKRDPIHTFIRRDLKARGRTLAVNCVGIRAEESTSRARKNPFALNARLSKAGREVYEWFPIFEFTLDQVWATIAAAGQEPHRVYLEGNERLSCVVCIMGCKGDIANAARLRPSLFRRYVELERRTGYTVFRNESLLDRAGVTEIELEALELATVDLTPQAQEV